VRHNRITRQHVGSRPQGASLERIVREHLEQLLESPQFDGSARSRDFLTFVVSEVLAGRGDRLNQASIAATVFGRQGNFDPMLDPVVRVQAGRLRRSLERYYLLTKDTATVRIELPKGSYAPAFVTKVANKDGSEPTLKRISLALVAPEWPAVVVHPFQISPEDSDAAAQFKDELAMELGRHGNVRVVRHTDLERLEARQQGAVRFELRGTVRRSEGEWNIVACLVDRSNGAQLWGDEYRTARPAPSDLAAVEDVARVIAASVGAEHGVIARLLASEHGAGHPEVVNSVGAIASCYHFFLSRRVSEVRPTIDALQRVIVREPEVALAWNYLSRLYQVNYSFELTDLPTPIDKAISYAYQGVLLEPTGARIRCTLAAALLVKGEASAAREELEQALRLNARSLAYHETIGWLLALSGDWERGIAIMRDASARNPYCLPHVKHGLWANHLRRGEFDEAYTAALEYRDSSFFWRELMIACCLGHLGRLDEARTRGTELLGLKPGFAKRGRTLIGYYIKPPELRERVAEGLRKADVTLS
jgi:adenylate cyclase